MSSRKGSEILQLLSTLTREQLTEDIEDLYDAAYNVMSANPDKAIELGKKALLTLDRLYSVPLGDSNALIYARGRCHVLIASIFLNQEQDFKAAEEHYLLSRDAFHSRQWSHLESLAYLGATIARRKLNDLKGALITCKSAQDSVEHESIPAWINTLYLRKAIQDERLEIQQKILT